MRQICLPNGEKVTIDFSNYSYFGIQYERRGILFWKRDMWMVYGRLFCWNDDVGSYYHVLYQTGNERVANRVCRDLQRIFDELAPKISVGICK